MRYFPAAGGGRGSKPKVKSVRRAGQSRLRARGFGRASRLHFNEHSLSAEAAQFSGPSVPVVGTLVERLGEKSSWRITVVATIALVTLVEGLGATIVLEAIFVVLVE